MKLVAIVALVSACWTSSPSPPPPLVPAPAPIAKRPARPATEPTTPTVVASCDEVSCVLDPNQACCSRFPTRYRPQPQPTPPQNGVPDSIDRAMITAGIARVMPDIRACGSVTTAKGVVKVSVRVDPNGAVTSVTILTAPDQALGDCVHDAMSRATFGQTVNGGSFAYPLVF